MFSFASNKPLQCIYIMSGSSCKEAAPPHMYSSPEHGSSLGFCDFYPDVTAEIRKMCNNRGFGTF